MKKFLFIIYLLFLSCDSSEIFGVHELDNTTLDYYDYVARGWQAVFDGDFDLAFSDFNEATLLDSVEHKNSAYVGLGWTATFYANSFFNSAECLASNNISCDDVVDGLRLDAKNYFNSANIDVPNAIDEYNEDNLSNGGFYINTFEEFDIDRQIGEIYLSLLEFDMTEFDLGSGADTDNNGVVDDFEQLTNIVDALKQFLVENNEYDIANNKPPYISTYDFESHHLYGLLSQLKLRLGDSCEAEYYLIEQNLCPGLYPDGYNCYDFNNNQCICNDTDIDNQLLLECIQIILQ